MDFNITASMGKPTEMWLCQAYRNGQYSGFRWVDERWQFEGDPADFVAALFDARASEVAELRGTIRRARDKVCQIGTMAGSLDAEAKIAALDTLNEALGE